jgi:hypothetical protein
MTVIPRCILLSIFLFIGVCQDSSFRTDSAPGIPQYSGDVTLKLTYETTAPWSPRDSFGATSISDSPFEAIIGGGFTPARSKELWTTADFVFWQQIVDNGTHPSVRNGHCIVRAFGKLVLRGGFDGQGFHSDVYQSNDGRTWVRNGDAPWPARAFFGCVVFDKKIYVMGGNSKSPIALNDVWVSSDAQIWTLVTPRAEWVPRGMFAAFSSGGRMYVVGGGVYDEAYVYNISVNFNDIWSTVDGLSWVGHGLAPFSPRRFMGVAQTNKKTYLVGGFELDTRVFQDPRAGIRWDAEHIPPLVKADRFGTGRIYGNLNEIWSSSDGVFWKKEASPVEFQGRHAPGAVGVGDKIFVFGGFGKDIFNDVWIGREVSL